MMSKSRALDFVKKLTQQTLMRSTYEQCLRNVEFVSAGNGNCVAEFTVSEEHLNFGGTLHGSFTSTIIDCVSSLALMTTGRGVESVSVDLHVSFLEDARLGDVIIIDSKTVKAGRRLAFLAVELSKKSDGTVVARGGQTKFIGES